MITAVHVWDSGLVSVNYDDGSTENFRDVLPGMRDRIIRWMFNRGWMLNDHYRWTGTWGKPRKHMLEE